MYSYNLIKLENAGGGELNRWAASESAWNCENAAASIVSLRARIAGMIKGVSFGLSPDKHIAKKGIQTAQSM